MVIVVDTLVLSATEDASFLQVLFEVVAALGTVGLSAGITAGLSILGKLILSATMLTGRLGTLAIGLRALREASETAIPVRRREGLHRLIAVMSDVRIVLRDVGGVLALVGGLMPVPLLVSLVYGEFYTALAFVISAAMTAGAGWLAWSRTREAAEPKDEGQRQFHKQLITKAIYATGWDGTVRVVARAVNDITVFREF